MIWKVEVLSVGVTRGDHCGWKEVFASRDEQQVRQRFGEIEAECASNQRGHTEIKLWAGSGLMLHVWWNRGVPNKEDGMRDWSR